MDGEIIPISEAKISVTDWGLTRSDITYDVVHVWKGKFFRLNDYVARFRQSLNALRMDIPQDNEEIKRALHEMVARSGLRDAYVSMVASRGVPSIPGSRDPRVCTNHFYAWVVPFVWVIKPEVAEQGASLKISRTAERIAPRSVDPTVKNYHWGDMTRAHFEALDDGYDTALLLDESGFVTEGPGFNVFAVINGAVVTPRAGMLEGITRRTVLEIAEEMGISTEIRDVTEAEMLEADEAFTATTAGGPVPVVRIDNRILGNGAPGRITEEILIAYWRLHEREDLNDAIAYDTSTVSQ